MSYFIIYVITNKFLIDCHRDGDIEPFAEFVNDGFLIFNIYRFVTEEEAIAFLQGLNGSRLALCSWIEEDKPYINIINKI